MYHLLGEGDVLVVVARIEPAARHVAVQRRVGGVVEVARLGVLARAHEALGVGPVGLGVGLRLGRVRAVVVEHPQGVVQHAVVHIWTYVKTRRALARGRIHDDVAAGRRHAREVEPPAPVTALRVGGAAVPRHGRAAVHEGVGVGLAHLQRCAGREAEVAVVAHERVGEHGHLLGTRQVAKLIDVDVGRGGGLGQRRGGEEAERRGERRG